MTTKTEDGAIRYRPFAEADFPAAAQLVSDANRRDGTDWYPSAEGLRHDLGHDDAFRVDEDGRVAQADGRLVGTAFTSWRRRGDKVVHRIDLTVAPDHRRRGIGTALLAWAERHVVERVRAGLGGPSDLRHELGGWGQLDVPGHAELAAAHGYRVVRYGMDMLRPVSDPIPEAPLPDGIEVRPVRREDWRQIWQADEEAFRDHWEAGVRTEADFEWLFGQPHLDTSLWQVAWEGDEVVGSVMTRIDADDNAALGITRAWLDHISVRRPWRRRGVAAALIASTLRLLAERGVEQAGLGVDTENLSGAVRLYERLGFVRHEVGAQYRKPLET
jgi:mycothiol synthase